MSTHSVPKWYYSIEQISTALWFSTTSIYRHKRNFDHKLKAKLILRKQYFHWDTFLREFRIYAKQKRLDSFDSIPLSSSDLFNKDTDNVTTSSANNSFKSSSTSTQNIDSSSSFNHPSKVSTENGDSVKKFIKPTSNVEMSEISSKSRDYESKYYESLNKQNDILIQEKIALEKKMDDLRRSHKEENEQLSNQLLKSYQNVERAFFISERYDKTFNQQKALINKVLDLLTFIQDWNTVSFDEVKKILVNSEPWNKIEFQFSDSNEIKQIESDSKNHDFFDKLKNIDSDKNLAIDKQPVFDKLNSRLENSDRDRKIFMSLFLFLFVSIIIYTIIKYFSFA